MNLKHTLVPFLLLAAVCIPARAESWGAGLAGLYLTVDGGAQVRVTQAPDGTYTGKLIWLRDDKDRLDKNNPDPARKAVRVLGLVILRGLKANVETKRWEGGTIYDPKNGKTYDAFAWRVASAAVAEIRRTPPSFAVEPAITGTSFCLPSLKIA